MMEIKLLFLIKNYLKFIYLKLFFIRKIYLFILNYVLIEK
jgi:hypothetical protein